MRSVRVCGELQMRPPRRIQQRLGENRFASRERSSFDSWQTPKRRVRQRQRELLELFVIDVVARGPSDSGDWSFPPAPRQCHGMIGRGRGRWHETRRRRLVKVTGDGCRRLGSRDDIIMVVAAIIVKCQHVLPTVRDRGVMALRRCHHCTAAERRKSWIACSCRL